MKTGLVLLSTSFYMYGCFQDVLVRSLKAVCFEPNFEIKDKMWFQLHFYYAFFQYVCFTFTEHKKIH